jgi:hypothetical protein
MNSARVDNVLPTLTFRLTRTDWAAFEQLPAELNGWEKLYVFAPPVVLAMLAVALEGAWRAILPTEPDSTVETLLLSTVVLALAYAITVALLTIRTRQRIARRQVPTTDTTIEGDLDGLAITENGTTHHHAWADLTVIETPTHLFLCPSPRQAIILPLRSFDSPEAMHLYAHNARELAEPAIS